jgi:putative transposase
VRFVDSVFGRVLEPLDRRAVSRAVAAHDGNRNVGEGEGSWTCQRHLKALLFAQLAGLSSLREIVEALSSRPTALYHLAMRPPRRSTLSDASAMRPAAVFADICRDLMAKASPRMRRDGNALVRIIDATGIPLRDQRFAFAEADARLRGLKLHLVFDPEAERPVRFAITSPRVSDVTVGRSLALETGATYIFDKGYTHYSWWQEMVAAGAFFVTRLRHNVHRRTGAPITLSMTPDFARSSSIGPASSRSISSPMITTGRPRRSQRSTSSAGRSNSSSSG